MQQAINSAYEQWDRRVPPLREEVKALREENRDMIRKIEKLENLKAGWNPLRWAFNQVAQNYKLPKLETQLAANNKRLQIINENVQYLADQCASIIFNAYLRGKPEMMQMVEKEGGSMTALNYMRRDVLSSLKLDANGKAFIDDLLEHMPADEASVRTNQDAKPENRPG